MISALISRASAAFLAVGGLALLFAPDDILPRVIPNFPVTASWLGQLIAAGWLALAVLNWFSRASVLGGIYARPIVLANALFYFIGATTLFRSIRGHVDLSVLWWVAVPVTLFAAIYIRLLFGGPINADVDTARATPSKGAPDVP
ncbi:MAG TPA: hypothetical protein VGM77_02635 [Gemmatimonadales bacterium]|jgi:hypothetical protein